MKDNKKPLHEWEIDAYKRCFDEIDDMFKIYKKIKNDLIDIVSMVNKEFNESDNIKESMFQIKSGLENLQDEIMCVYEYRKFRHS